MHTWGISSPAPDEGMHGHVHAADPDERAVHSPETRGVNGNRNFPKLAQLAQRLLYHKEDLPPGLDTFHNFNCHPLAIHQQDKLPKREENLSLTSERTRHKMTTIIVGKSRRRVM